MKVPFYPNLKDDVHCVQAVLRMVLAAEGRTVSMRELDRLTHRHSNQWTWPAAAALAMNRLGFESSLISGIGDMDFHAFAKQGQVYLRKLWTPDTLAAEAAHTSIERQRILAKVLVEEGDWIDRPATTKDLRRFFREGYYVVLRVNARALNGKEGFFGHWVLVTDIHKNGLTVHDPGLPGRPYRRISWSLLYRAFLNNMALFRPK